MAAPAKFLFDVDFADGGKPTNTITLAEHNAKLADAETAAYRSGFAAAAAEAAAATARRTAEALEQAAATLKALALRLAEVEGRFEAEAVEVAVAVARKLAPELIAREPMAELAALVTGCFRHLVAAPHIVVRVSETIYEPARAKLDAIAREAGFQGRLVVLAEPGIAPGDCRIEWADGGLNRSRAEAEAAIEDAVNRYLAARRAGVV